MWIVIARQKVSETAAFRYDQRAVAGGPRVSEEMVAAAKRMVG